MPGHSRTGVRVSAGTEDAEERISGAVNLSSTDLELVDETKDPFSSDHNFDDSLL